MPGLHQIRRMPFSVFFSSSSEIFSLSLCSPFFSSAFVRFFRRRNKRVSRMCIVYRMATWRRSLVGFFCSHHSQFRDYSFLLAFRFMLCGFLIVSLFALPMFPPFGFGYFHSFSVDSVNRTSGNFTLFALWAKTTQWFCMHCAHYTGFLCVCVGAFWVDRLVWWIECFLFCPRNCFLNCLKHMLRFRLINCWTFIAARAATSSDTHLRMSVEIKIVTWRYLCLQDSFTFIRRTHALKDLNSTCFFDIESFKATQWNACACVCVTLDTHRQTNLIAFHSISHSINISFCSLSPHPFLLLVMQRQDKWKKISIKQIKLCLILSSARIIQFSHIYSVFSWTRIRYIIWIVDYYGARFVCLSSHLFVYRFFQLFKIVHHHSSVYSLGEVERKKAQEKKNMIDETVCRLWCGSLLFK